ncbi:MAG: hypothetical protein F8N36_14430 [Desulfovibrio sp.]|uniref:hypothetical protein n=1 Tax=Desulfovibrio sp. TaxID=885 RepID=UPI00135EE878|nr:hypothetical protein [Desulfovibrio sp.]MTJ94035.1 hypothetical protein [Desulfovibrio sp.]
MSELEYLVDLSAFTENRIVREVVLAHGLDFRRKDASITLLTHLVDGVEYDLRLCGPVALKRGHKIFYGSDIPKEVLLMADGTERGEILPWFEWVNSQGDPVSGRFDVISADPAVEIAKLERALRPLLVGAARRL